MKLIGSFTTIALTLFCLCITSSWCAAETQIAPVVTSVKNSESVDAHVREAFVIKELRVYSYLHDEFAYYLETTPESKLSHRAHSRLGGFRNKALNALNEIGLIMALSEKKEALSDEDRSYFFKKFSFYYNFESPPEQQTGFMPKTGKALFEEFSRDVTRHFKDCPPLHIIELVVKLNKLLCELVEEGKHIFGLRPVSHPQYAYKLGTNIGHEVHRRGMPLIEEIWHNQKSYLVGGAASLLALYVLKKMFFEKKNIGNAPMPSQAEFDKLGVPTKSWTELLQEILKQGGDIKNWSAQQWVAFRALFSTKPSVP